MKALRNLFLTFGILTLTACNAFTSFSEIKALNEAEAVGTPFTIALANEYREFSNNEMAVLFDYPDALHFARKGLAAASGEEILPEQVGDWNLADGDIQELNAARGRLMVAFNLNARNVAPELAAKAQAKFDCWIEEQEEYHGKKDIGCKSEFLDIMNQLEGMLQAPPPAPILETLPPVTAIDVDPSEPMAPEDAVYLVFFDWDSSALTVGAGNVLDAVADEVRKNPPSQLTIVGHADTSGPKTYNQRLAFRRATAVRDALTQRGVDQSLIAIESRGEDELLVPTPDNVREPANRRANISFE